MIDDKSEELLAHQDRLILTENYSGMSEADVAMGILLVGGSGFDSTGGVAPWIEREPGDPVD